jgi:hypothetical protein
VYTNSPKDIPNNKKAKTPEEVEKYFPGFLAFVDSTEQQIRTMFLIILNRLKNGFISRIVMM